MTLTKMNYKGALVETPVCSFHSFQKPVIMQPDASDIIVNTVQGQSGQEREQEHDNILQLDQRKEKKRVNLMLVILV